MESKRTRTGSGYIGLFPPIAMFLVQFIVNYAILCVLVIYYVLQGDDWITGVEHGFMLYANNLIEFLSVIQGFYIFFFGLWYYRAFLFGRKEKRKSNFSFLSIFSILFLALGFYFATNILLIVWGLLFPEVIQNYNLMIDNVGIGELTFISTISSVILAPISEELVFRGLSMRYLQRIHFPFWIVNFLQALMFGLIHMNLVQGFYAFLLGLLLGYTADRYKTIWASILLHMIFNFLGTYLATALGLIEQEFLLLFTQILFALLFLILGGLLLKKEKSVFYF